MEVLHNDKIKSINNNDYVANIVADLGLIEEYNKKYRYVLIECVKCKTRKKKRINDAKRLKTNLCLKCYNFMNKPEKSFQYIKIQNCYFDMIRRCYKNSYSRYKDYGGRGIKVCDEWLNNKKAFNDWAVKNKGHIKETSLDRIDNNKGYSPDNCRFTTREIQQRNTRKLYAHNTSGYRGVHFDKSKYSFVAVIVVNNHPKKIKQSKCRLECAYAYDEYVISNNLEHTRNFT